MDNPERTLFIGTTNTAPCQKSLSQSASLEPPPQFSVGKTTPHEAFQCGLLLPDCRKHALLCFRDLWPQQPAEALTVMVMAAASQQGDAPPTQRRALAAVQVLPALRWHLQGAVPRERRMGTKRRSLSQERSQAAEVGVNPPVSQRLHVYPNV